MTILRYLGRKYGLEADDEWDRAVADELAQSWFDMYTRMAVASREPDKELKKQKYLQVNEFVKPRLKIFDERISHNAHGFLAGNKVTWADFAVYNELTMIRDYLKVPISEYTHLQKYVNMIEQLPSVKKWLQEHPNVPYSVFPNPLD